MSNILPIERPSNIHRIYSKDLNYIANDFLELMESLEHLIIESALAINKAKLEYFIPFHYNTIEVTIPSYHIQKFVQGMDADITILFSRTKFTEKHNLEYTFENVIDFYKNVSITIGKHGSNRVYHINAKASSENGETPYRMIVENIKRLYSIHEKNQLFSISADDINNIIKDNLTIVNPTSSNFPRSFSL